MGQGGFGVGSWWVQSRVTASERPDPLLAWVQIHCWHGSSQIHGVARSIGLIRSFVAVGLFLVWVFLILIWCG
jgi:hypothetical protein